MRIKTFYARNMNEAFREIQEVLGPDAVLLATKELPCRSGAWGRSPGFEVTAAVDYPENGEAPDLETLVRLAAQEESVSPVVSVPDEKTAAAHPPEGGVSIQERQAFKGRVVQSLYTELVNCGVEDDLARRLMTNACKNLAAAKRRSRSALMDSVVRAVQSLMPDSSNENDMPGKKVVAFIGPTGVGKTTSIAKLAAYLALNRKKKVMVVTMDGYRIGAVDQLRSYTGLMGIPFRFVDKVSELPGLIEDNRLRDFILIDTAGRSPRDMADMQPLTDFLGKSDHIERHLVLSASMKPSDMRRIIQQFESCNPDHLLFTKLDETSTPGPILNELVRTQKRFSWYADGQNVPDDLHAVPSERIIDLILNRTENL